MSTPSSLTEQLSKARQVYVDQQQQRTRDMFDKLLSQDWYSGESYMWIKGEPDFNGPLLSEYGLSLYEGRPDPRRIEQWKLLTTHPDRLPPHVQLRPVVVRASNPLRWQTLWEAFVTQQLEEIRRKLEKAWSTQPHPRVEIPMAPKHMPLVKERLQAEGLFVRCVEGAVPKLVFQNRPFDEA